MRVVLIVLGLLLLLLAGAMLSGAMSLESLTSLAGSLKPGPEVLEQADVLVSTDQDAYPVAQPVLVTIENRSDHIILSHVGTRTPVYAVEFVERLEPDGRWSRFRAQCEYPNCRYIVHNPNEILPGKKEQFRWKPALHPDGQLEALPMGPGTYRLIVRFQDRPDEQSAWVWQRVRSPELVVR